MESVKSMDRRRTHVTMRGWALGRTRVLSHSGNPDHHGCAYVTCTLQVDVVRERPARNPEPRATPIFGAQSHLASSYPPGGLDIDAESESGAS